MEYVMINGYNMIFRDYRKVKLSEMSHVICSKSMEHVEPSVDADDNNQLIVLFTDIITIFYQQPQTGKWKFGTLSREAREGRQSATIA
ncbi:CLUMA_CG011549, isoform A [Clunio marinus]|uniref:CLUMA_CG011549, isoform A n=1 Tax=Clunio marinus TaxID=568069 RepID=A0A1J1ID86_9DIPT|nr:CLUMA_CG011549, isoform A [Clunio marinus]